WRFCSASKFSKLWVWPDPDEVEVRFMASVPLASILNEREVK
ncbi:MAG: hypothetical protein K0Q50_2964, partial [Vampirovibrio sp.]|nr:hypothetical protein [Vampirovibrio sp.]